jgi:hypothetical protein
MPRYYFRLTDGKRTLDNHRGIDLPGNAAARTDAVALAHDLKQGHAMSGWIGQGGLSQSSINMDARSTRCRSLMLECAEHWYLRCIPGIGARCSTHAAYQ